MEPLLEGASPRKPEGLWRLYLSHFLSTFGDRVWQFAVPVIFMTIWNDTLLPGAVSNFVINILTAFVFPNIGAWVDRTPRRRAMAMSIFGEAASMVAAGAVFVLMLAILPEQGAGEEWVPPPWTPPVAICYALVIVFSSITEIAMQAGSIALETDWPATIVPKAQDAGGKVKAELNSCMSSIDQLNKLLGPTAYGLIIQLFGGRSTREQILCGIGVVVAWNALCVPLEWLSVASVYRSYPALASRDEPKKAKKKKTCIGELRAGWKVWIGHPMCAASFSATIISFTVLNASSLTTAWCVWAGIPLGLLGILRGLAAVSGLAGSWSYRWVYARAGSPQRTAQVGICTFSALLLPCAASMAVFGSSSEGAWVLNVAITMSRFALFWFKPAMSQLVQEHVAEDVRGAFMGVQKSLNKAFTVGVAGVAILFAAPAQFPVLVYMSVVAVTMAAVVYSAWMRRGALPAT